MKNKKIKVFLLLSLMLLPFIPKNACAYSEIPIGAFFYVWYGYNSTLNSWSGGNGTSHWNDGGANIVTDYPIFGYYSSIHNVTLSNQITLMKSVGIDFAIISWWGENHITNNATINVFKWLEDNGTDFKVCLIVEPYEGINYTEVYNFVYLNLVEPYEAWYMNFKDKPLLFFFNPVYEDFYKDNRFNVYVVGNPPNNVDLVFWKGMDCLDAYGGVENIEWYSGNPVINNDGVVSIVPKYDDKLMYDVGARETFMQFDGSLTKGLYLKEWNYVIRNKDYVKMVLIYSWNEYHERTAIEPHIDYSTGKSQDYLLQQTEYYIKQFESYETPQKMVNFGLEFYGVVIGCAVLLAIAGIIKKNI